MSYLTVESLSKSFYLQCVKQVSRFSYKKKDKVVFMLSFPSTSSYILEKLYKHYEDRLVVCYTPNSREVAKKYKEKGCRIINLNSFDAVLRRVVPELKKAKVIICDNYFAVLGGINFSNDVKIIQIWHANGAIKKFGFEAEYVRRMTQIDKKRYQQVYNQFTHYVVSSQHMANIFASSYHSSINTLPFGYPLTDIYFDNDHKKEVLKRLKEDNPKGKKIVLYVPTYREEKMNNPLDFTYMEKKLGDEWILIVHPHPHDKELYLKLSSLSSHNEPLSKWSLSDLLFVTDCLVTDYSSVPFEYSLANPMGRVVYYCFDYKEYDHLVGIQDDAFDENNLVIEDWTEALLKKILAFDEFDCKAFNRKWNSFVNGTAAKQLIDWIDKQYEN
jgi:CDP-glycerol glycerophosphotransferase (TagB/SpsB family)